MMHSGIITNFMFVYFFYDIGDNFGSIKMK